MRASKHDVFMENDLQPSFRMELSRSKDHEIQRPPVLHAIGESSIQHVRGSRQSLNCQTHLHCIAPLCLLEMR
jgi:hypothetical protein